MSDETSPTVAFVRLLPNTVPRVRRMMRFARSLGWESVYIGAHRGAIFPSTEESDNGIVYRVGKELPNFNGKHALTYVRGVASFNFSSLRKLFDIRPQAVHCSDLESFPAGLAYRAITGAPLIYNIHDNYAERYSVPSWIHYLLNSVEAGAVVLSHVTLVPEPFRRDALPSWCRKKIVVVRNAPEPLEPAAPHDDFGDRAIRIIYAGWIDEGRGIRELVALANENPQSFEIEIAGDGDADLVALIKSSHVAYLGSISHEETLERFRHNDFIAAIYGPSRPINRMAAPNKLAEALALGRPVITNTEILMTSGAEFRECAVRVAHRDLDQLPKILLRLREEGPEAYASMSKAARQTYDREYSWQELESGMRKVYSRAGIHGPVI